MGWQKKVGKMNAEGRGEQSLGGATPSVAWRKSY